MNNQGPPLMYWQCPTTRRNDNGLIRGVKMHSKEPQLYFNPFIPFLSPEFDFNHSRYCQHEFEAILDKEKLSDDSIRDEICGDDVEREPSLYASRVMKLRCGKIVPAYVPLLSDLNGYLHKGVGIFVKWFYKHHVFEQGELVPKQIVPILDLKPSFEAEVTPTYTLPTETRQIMFGANTNSIHVMKILTRICSIELNVYSCVTAKNGVRYSRISVCGVVEITGQRRQVFPERGHVVFWNARDVHRESFSENFRLIYYTYNPFLIVITEARPRYFQKYDVLSRVCGNYQIEISGTSGVGGVLIMWNKVAKPQFFTRSSAINTLSLSAEILPGPTFDPPTSPMVEDQHTDKDDDADDDDDYIGNWLVNSGLDANPSIHDEGWC